MARSPVRSAIFYPGSNEDCAIQIARDRKVPASRAGSVTRLLVREDFMARHPLQTVGGRRHTEWRIPAEELELFNANIVGPIEVVHEFRAS